MQTLFRKSAQLAMVAICCLILGACNKPPEEKPKNGAGIKKRPVPVLLGTAQQRSVPVELQATGTVEAYASVAIKAQVSGILEKIHFQEGQEVAAGDGERLKIG